ncbi:hypothetical protein KDA_76470 [Dictyobacter alpinus]|uniref:Uncharacterized protein n=1 Tax=Dictyobacter alpinus TaxID=2014873 RepID=A0A402BLC7_9CHLR|nr:hypothetical protein [Dictyobacter alpinus]GCE32163.1 hypothetical protein KDA_76470 [Dictyobacter alpinus]
MQLEQLTSDQLQKGMTIVHFEPPGTVHVGRIHSEITRHPPLQAFTTGIFAEFDLLYADEYGEAGNEIWQKYFYWNQEAPTHAGVFKWPNLMKLSFQLAESSLKMGRMGWLFHIEVRSPFGPARVIEVEV